MLPALNPYIYAEILYYLQVEDMERTGTIGLAEVTATTGGIEAKKTGTYCFNVTDANGCSNAVCVQVTLDSAFVNIGAKLKCLTCSHDTAAICTGSSFTMLPYDTIQIH